ncbi:hypothetical protein SCALM49S_03909 [Streptomyces californicus]
MLTGDGHLNTAYELSGDTAWLLAAYAALLSELTGEEIARTGNVPAAVHQEILVGAGVPEGFAAILVDVDAAIERGRLAGRAVTSPASSAVRRRPSPRPYARPWPPRPCGPRPSPGGPGRPPPSPPSPRAPTGRPDVRDTRRAHTHTRAPHPRDSRPRRRARGPARRRAPRPGARVMSVSMRRL